MEVVGSICWDLKMLAARLAEDAYENHFPSRRGVWEIEGSDLICVYDNSPSNDLKKGRSQRRERELAELTRRLKQLGGKRLSRATYSSGYTVALLFDGVSQDQVIETWRAIRHEHAERQAA